MAEHIDGTTGKETQRVRKPVNVVLTIGGSLAFGSFLVWIVTVDWMLDFVALFVLLGCAALGFVAGRLVYRNLSPALHHWERVTVAVILGFSVFLAVGELTHSHKLVNAYQHWSSDNDE